jgi:hypothetical protein
MPPLWIKRARLADIVSGRACSMFSVACAIRNADSCTIILPFESGLQNWLDHMEDPIDLKLFDELLRRHEIGHCNGWPQTHPNAVYLEEYRPK